MTPGPSASQMARAIEKQRRLTREEVREIRLSMESSAAVARTLGVSADVVGSVRKGTHYGKLKPDEKRAKALREMPPDDRPLAPWHYLIVGHVHVRSGMADAQDRQEQFDAAWECSHGRLPHDATPPCGCWPQERPTLSVIAGQDEQLELEAAA